MIKLKKIVTSHNVAELLTDEQLAGIGQDALKGYTDDLQSREEWEQRMAEAFRMGLQIKEEKTYPWPGASNVRFPLITVGALQFHARAYPQLVPSTGLVKAEAYGKDDSGKMTTNARAISELMTWQLMEEAPEWEENMDRALLILPILGTVFKKTYFDPIAGRNRHDLVMPKDLVVNYYTDHLDNSPRVTHRIPFSRNEYREKVLRGIYLDEIEDLRSLQQPSTRNSELEEVQHASQGIRPPAQDSTAPIYILEQYTWLDLDEDGYAEPYIVSVIEASGQVVRIVARFLDHGDVHRLDDGKGPIVRITPRKYFTKYEFMPSPDGGFYGIGWGTLLGSVSSAIDTAINQLTDAGTLNNLGGGFLGPGVSIKGGVSEREPGAWIPLNGRGDNVNNSFAPYPQTPPSPILFQLLQLLISYGERIVGAVDSMMGELPGHNMKTGASDNALEQGMTIYAGIFKRVYRSMKHEFNLVHELNKLYMEPTQHYRTITTGEFAIITMQEYVSTPVNVVPVADPNMISNSQRLKQATAMLEDSRSSPGYDMYEVHKNFLEALKIRDADRFYPDPKGQRAIKQPVPLLVQVEQIKAQGKQMDAQVRLKMAVMKLEGEVQLNQAKIDNLQAQAVKALADAKGVDSGHAIALIEAEIGATKNHNEHLLKIIDMMRAENDRGMGESPNNATAVHAAPGGSEQSNAGLGQ